MSCKPIKDPENTCFNCFSKKDIIKIDIPELGYGSYFDNTSGGIVLCNSCYENKTDEKWWELNIVKLGAGLEYEYEDEILSFIHQLPIAGQEAFFNRDNAFIDMKSQDWIDYKLNKLPHEKCKEHGLYSPQEIEAYELKYPQCQYVVNVKFNDGSMNSMCPFEASGKANQIINQTSRECFHCNHFKKRQSPIKTINYKDWEDYKAYAKSQLKELKYKNKFGEIE